MEYLSELIAVVLPFETLRFPDFQDKEQTKGHFFPKNTFKNFSQEFLMKFILFSVTEKIAFEFPGISKKILPEQFWTV